MEFQSEEREVVQSIYDGDPAFNQLSPVTFQYKYGKEGEPKSVMIELSWGEKYPDEKPTLNLDTFYNRHINGDVKKRISKFLLDEAEQLLGSPMTYSLFECLKDKFEELIGDNVSEPPQEDPEDESSESESDSEEGEVTTKKQKKSHLTKAQKRKQWDRVDSKGEKARGWDWIDVIHHLSQSGPKGLEIPNSTF